MQPDPLNFLVSFFVHPFRWWLRFGVGEEGRGWVVEIEKKVVAEPGVVQAVASPQRRCNTPCL
jgi:hypothetical protein